MAKKDKVKEISVSEVRLWVYSNNQNYYNTVKLPYTKRKLLIFVFPTVYKLLPNSKYYLIDILLLIWTTFCRKATLSFVAVVADGKQ